MVQHELNVKNLCFKFIEDVIFQIKFKGKSFIFYKEKIIYKWIKLKERNIILNDFYK